MKYPDFQARAELYLGSDWATATEQGPRSFRTAAQAIRFAFEEAAPVNLRGARLHIGDAEFSGDQLTRLYRSPHYPLMRKRAGQHVPTLKAKPHQRKGDPEDEEVRLRRHGGSLPQQALRQVAGHAVPALR